MVLSMQRVLRSLAVLVPLVWAAACANPATPGSSSFSTPAEPPTDIESAREVWAAADVGAYALRIQTSCFCELQDYRTTVDGSGAVTGGAPEDYLPETVDDLHALIQDAYDRDAAQVEVTYDLIGVPVSVYIDSDANMIDEEIGYEVSFQDRP
jgi:hypothetical protein